MSAPAPDTGRKQMVILRYLPAVVMAAPERIFLKFAVAVIGVGLLVGAGSPDSTLAEFPTWAIYELGITFLLGGSCALIGIVRSSRALERFGLAATGFASVMYAFGIAVLYGTSRYPGIVIFSGLALACLTRLLVSTAAAKVLLATQAHAYVRSADLDEQP